MAPPTILVVGATGKQGKAVISALHEETSEGQQPKILALTRSSSSGGAQALRSKFPAIELVEGDMKDPEPVFAQNTTITTVFFLTNPPDEEQQGIPLIDAALKHSNVKHIVFSSVERGGDERSWSNPTDVPHFITKHNIELHLRNATAKASHQITWTVLRPVAFMNNLSPPGMFGPMFGAMWNTMPAETKLQLVSTADIGKVAARALLNPQKYSGRAIGLAGDELTFAEAKEVYRESVGKQNGTELPQTYWVLGKGIRTAITDVRKMFNFFEAEGYGVNIEALKREEGVLSFAEWLRTKESGLASI